MLALLVITIYSDPMNTTINLAFLSPDDVNVWTADDDCMMDADPIVDSHAYAMWMESQHNDISDFVLDFGITDAHFLFNERIR